MSQSFDLPNTTSTASTSDIPAAAVAVARIENKWIPQPSTNLLKPPQIMEYGPLQGQAGDSFHVDLNTHNLDANTLRIAFNSCFTTCHCTLNTVTQIITLHTTVPSATMVACNDMSRIPIYIVVVQDEKILDSWFIGYFGYHLTRKRASTEFNPIDMHAVNDESKRPRSDPFSSMGYPTAAAATSSSPSPQQSNYYIQQQQQQPHAPYVGLPPTQPSPNRQQREFYEDPNMYTTNSTSTNSNVAAAVAAAAAGVYNTSTPTDPNQFQSYNPNYSPLSQQPPPQPPPPPPQDNYMMPMMSSMSQQPTTSTALPTTSTPTAASVPPIQMKPSMPLPISISPILSHSTNMPPTSATAQQQQQQQQQQTSPTSNPFANLLNKANLIIEGDLADVLKDWSPEEWENQRRLVQFFRKQEGNEVTCRFETFHLPAEKSKQPDMNKIIVVSCIYWKEKNEYFVTSVDCIYLLEHLIGVKFTVEEKNRIRRNLEGYKPLTVSKLKPESAEFFKLIMGFPNPKPRNIEKDVKVFPWTTLGTALKKIISKYTASYSSTASVNYDLLNTDS